MAEKDLLHTVLVAFQQGIKKPIQNTSETSGEAFYRALQATTEARLPLKEQLLVHKCREKSKQGLHAARRGHLATAKQLFEENRAIVSSKVYSLESRLICESFHKAAEAYLDYRCGNFDQARAHVHQALAIDFVLQEEYEYAILQLHRTQLAHNLMRIDARCERFENAMGLGCRLLSYLEGSSERLPGPRPWRSVKIVSLSAGLGAGMCNQITGEIALILAGRSYQDARNLFAIVEPHAQMEATSNCHHYPQAHAWLRIKQAFLCNEVERFLKASSQFFADGRVDTPILWYASAVDLIALCARLKLPEAESVALQVARDILGCASLPQVFRTLLVVHPTAQ
jgi:tetratricopeptide (TPR) repeat protein